MIILTSIIISSLNENRSSISVSSHEDKSICNSFAAFNTLLNEDLINDDVVVLGGISELNRLSQGSSLQSLFSLLHKQATENNIEGMRDTYRRIGERCISIIR